MLLPTMPDPIQYVRNILNNMSASGFTLASFLLIVFTSIHFQIEMQELERSILPPIPSSHEVAIIRAWTLKATVSIYKIEVQTLMEKESGLQMAAYKLHPDQLEGGKVSENIYKPGVCCSHMSYRLSLHLRPS